MNKELLEKFPFKNFRKFQDETIDKIQRSFDSGKEFVIVESPTGSGKSAIAVTLSLYNGNSFILTSQKILQDQYQNDFSNKGMALLKGKSNYKCVYFKDCNCAEGCQQMIKKCPDRDICEYEIAKKKALQSPMLLTNYDYFFHVIEYAGFFEERNLTVYDEAHNLENSLLKFVEFSFSSIYLSKLGVTAKIPSYNTVEEYVHWVVEINGIIEKLIKQTSNELEALENSPDGVRIKQLKLELEMLEGQKVKIAKFLETYQQTEWIFDLTDSKVGNKITFKPLTIASFTKDILFSSSTKKLLMSATISGKNNICKALGIDLEACEYISVKSCFDTNRHPIYITNSGNMSMAKLDSTLPKVIEDLNTIFEHHKDDKGLIHAHTYKIAQYIKDNIDRKHKNRIITHLSDSREESLSDFIKSTEPKVMVTPSMTEGVDLKDELARFIVIVKIPYLYLGDKQVKKRMEIDSEWYKWKAALTLVQSAGRGMRHENDYCTIYIMDSGIRYFIKQNRENFPDYFVDSIQ